MLFRSLLVEAVKKAVTDRAVQTSGKHEAVIKIRSSDVHGNYFAGMHASMAIPRSAFNRIFELPAGRRDTSPGVRQLATYLLMSSLVLGNGVLRRDQDRADVQFVHPFERLHGFTKVTGAQTTAERGIINTRDEGHADARTHARLHVIALDVHTRPLATFLQLSALSAMLRTFELNSSLPEYASNPLQALWALKYNHDSLVTTVDASGTERSTRSYEYARRMFGFLSDLAQKEGFPEQEAVALERIVLGIDGFLEGRVDDGEVTDVFPWLLKHKLLAHKDLIGRPLKRPELELARAEVDMFDTYLVTPEGIVEGAYLKKFRPDKVVRVGKSQLMHPPEDTRAAGRAHKIAEVSAKPNLVQCADKGAYWDRMHWYEKNPETGNAERRTAHFINPAPMRNAQ